MQTLIWFIIISILALIAAIAIPIAVIRSNDSEYRDSKTPKRKRFGIDAGDEVEAILKKKAEADQQIEIARKEAEAAQIKAASDASVQKTLAEAEAYATTVKGKAAGDAASAYIRSVQSMVSRLYCSLNGIADADITIDADGNITSFKTIPAANEVMPYSECADLILGIIFYETWDGKLPEVVTNDSLSALIGALIAGGSSSSSNP